MAGLWVGQNARQHTCVFPDFGNPVPVPLICSCLGDYSEQRAELRHAGEAGGGGAVGTIPNPAASISPSCQFSRALTFDLELPSGLDSSTPTRC